MSICALCDVTQEYIFEIGEVFFLAVILWKSERDKEVKEGLMEATGKSTYYC